MKPLNPYLDQQFREVVLSRQQYVSEFSEAEDMRHTMSRAEYSTFTDDIKRQLIHRMTRDIYAVEHPTRNYRHPLNWWEHVKQRFAPAWFLKHWPVKVLTVNVSMLECYPDYKPSLLGHRCVVKMRINETKRP